MANYSQNSVVNVYAGDSVVEQVTREKARELKAAGTHFFINAGRDLRVIRPLYEVLKTKMQDAFDWTMHCAWRRSALNEGSSGQNIANYPIPYAYEGHLRQMRVSEVNA